MQLQILLKIIMPCPNPTYLYITLHTRSATHEKSVRTEDVEARRHLEVRNKVYEVHEAYLLLETLRKADYVGVVTHLKDGHSH